MAAIQNLNDLLDVDVPAPDDGDVLYWDAAAAKWKAKAFIPGGGTVERVIRFSSDDAFVKWTGAAWNLDSANERWHVGRWNSSEDKCGGGGRFLNIYIPNAATIARAYFKPTARSSDAYAQVKSRIHGEKNAAPATFSDYADYDARIRTDAVVTWDDIAEWTAGELYQSPELRAIIQEIVNLPAWASGNSLVLFWDDHEDRTPAGDAHLRRARSFDHDDPVPPMLYIEWVP